MRPVIVVLRRELLGYFSSLVAYVVLAVFVVGNGLFFWVFPGNILQSGEATLAALFSNAPWFFLLVVPALSMRALAEESRQGTLEWLLTRPLRRVQLVVGKYMAVLVLVALCLLLTLPYYLTVQHLGNPPGNLDAGATLGAYLGLFAVGACFAAVGLFTSCLTDHQVVAFLLGAFGCFFCYQGFALLAALPSLDAWAEAVAGLGLAQHYESISRGVVDARDVLYFITFIISFLSFTSLAISRR